MTHRAVFFDLGGTLFSYRSVRDAFQTMLQEIARTHGIQVAPDQLRNTYREAVGRVFEAYRARPFYLHRELFRDAERAFLEALGADGPPVERLYRAQSALGRAAVEARPGTRETLEALRARGLHLSVVSNIDDDQFHPLWERLGLAPLFDAFTTSEEARSCKPDPTIFRVALAKAGDPHPEEVVFVGDSVPHDVAGAAALGMTTVLISASSPREEPRPQHVISALPDLLDLVRA